MIRWRPTSTTTVTTGTDTLGTLDTGTIARLCRARHSWCWRDVLHDWHWRPQGLSTRLKLQPSAVETEVDLAQVPRRNTRRMGRRDGTVITAWCGQGPNASVPPKSKRATREDRAWIATSAGGTSSLSASARANLAALR